MTRTYSHLMSLPEYNDRFDYLKIKGTVGEPTFGWARYLNQVFYRSRAWRRVRDHVIVRDSGYDLAHPDHPIAGVLPWASIFDCASIVFPLVRTKNIKFLC